ncbi:MAG: hypothetical protein AAGD06_03760 [Acidobacteriota bacterium]
MGRRIEDLHRRIAAVSPRLAAELQRGRFSLSLLLERRLWIFVVADAMLVLSGAFEAAFGGGRVEGVYRLAVVIPSLVLGVPVLAGVVSLERRANSLDLALAVASTERYFLRRIAPVCAILIAQAWFILVLAYVENAGGPLDAVTAFPDQGPTLLRALLQSLEINLLLAAVVLFWAVRLRTPGAVWIASLATLLCLGPWLFSSPAFGTVGAPDRFLGWPLPPLRWTWNALVLAGATLIFYLYARYRLRRPETLLV